MNMQQAWNQYFTQVVPKGASKAQVRETKKAFYAGATVMYDLIAAVPETANKTQVSAGLEALSKECVDVMQSFMVPEQ